MPSVLPIFATSSTICRTRIFLIHPSPDHQNTWAENSPRK